MGSTILKMQCLRCMQDLPLVKIVKNLPYLNADFGFHSLCGIASQFPFEGFQICKIFFSEKLYHPNHDSAKTYLHADPDTSRCVDPPFLPTCFGAVVHNYGEFLYNSIGSQPRPPRGKPPDL